MATSPWLPLAGLGNGATRCRCTRSTWNCRASIPAGLFHTAARRCTSTSSAPFCQAKASRGEMGSAVPRGKTVPQTGFSAPASVIRRACSRSSFQVAGGRLGLQALLAVERRVERQAGAVQGVGGDGQLALVGGHLARGRDEVGRAEPLGAPVQRLRRDDDALPDQQGREGEVVGDHVREVAPGEHGRQLGVVVRGVDGLHLRGGVLGVEAGHEGVRDRAVPLGLAPLVEVEQAHRRAARCAVRPPPLPAAPARRGPRKRPARPPRRAPALPPGRCRTTAASHAVHVSCLLLPRL